MDENFKNKKGMSAEEFEHSFLMGQKPTSDVAESISRIQNAVHSAAEGGDREKEAEFRALYDEAFDHLMHEVKHNPVGNTGSLKLLQNLGEFRKNVMWAEDVNQTWTSLRAGTNVHGFMGILPPSHPQAQGPLMVPKLENRHAILEIRPYPITKEWAAILLTRDLTILRNKAYGLEKPGDETQLFELDAESYMLETAAAEQLSKGAYKKEIRDSAVKLGITNVKDFVSVREQSPRLLFDTSIQAIVNTVTSKASLSSKEQAMRLAAACMSLLYYSVWSEVTNRGAKPMTNKTSRQSIKRFGQVLKVLSSK